MLTIEDARAFLAELGLTLPDSILTCLVASVNAAEPCLIGLGLPECSIKLALLYAMAILSIGSGARRLRSQTAPSGASQSFEYGVDQSAVLRSNLRALGAWDCLGPILPPEQRAANGGIMVGLGARKCR